MGPFPHSLCADPSTSLAVPRVHGDTNLWVAYLRLLVLRKRVRARDKSISCFRGKGINLGAVKSACPLMAFKKYYLFTLLLVRRPRSSSMFLHIFQPFLLLCHISGVHPNISEPGNTIEAQRKSSSMSW